MQLELKTYLAGVATAGFAIAAGFGGGIFLGNSVDTHGAVPAPGLSRIERTKREEPKLAAVVETTARAPSAEEPAINPLAEARPVRANANNAEPATARADAGNQSPTPLPLQADRPPHEAALPAAIQAISLSRGHSRNLRHARTAERARIPDEPRVREQRARKKDKDIARKLESRQEPKSGLREVARYREGNVRYVVRTENGGPANIAEVDQLKRELRERRESRFSETRALSYGTERRGVFPQIFPD
jgi:hypothetical protein